MAGKDPGPHPVHNRSNPLRKLGGLTFASPDDPPPYAFTPDIASLLGFIDVLAPDRGIFQARDITFPNDRQRISKDKVLAILQGIPPDPDWPDQALYPAYLFANSSWRCDLLQSKEPGYKLETCFWSEIRVDDTPGQFQLPSGLCWRHRNLPPDPSLLVKNINLANMPNRAQWDMWSREGFPTQTQAVRSSTAIHILDSRESTVVDRWCGKANSDIPLPSPPLSASPIMDAQALVLSPSSTFVDRWTPSVPSRSSPTSNRPVHQWDDFHSEHSISTDDSRRLALARLQGTSRSLMAIEKDQFRLETQQKQLSLEKERQLKSSLADLERRLSKTEEERDSAISELRVVRGRLSNTREDSLQEQLHKVDGEARMLAERLSWAEEDFRKERAAVIRREAIIGDLKRQLEDDSIIEENASLRQEMEHLRDSARVVSGLEDEMQSARLQITQLKSNWATARREVSNSTELYRTARQEMQLARKDLLVEREKNRTKDHLITSLESAIRDKTTLADRSIRDLADARRHAALLEEKNADLQNRLDDWERKSKVIVAEASASSEETNEISDVSHLPTTQRQEGDITIKQDDGVDSVEVTIPAQVATTAGYADYDNDDDLADFMDLEDSSEDEKEDCDDDYVPPGSEEPGSTTILAKGNVSQDEDTKIVKRTLPFDSTLHPEQHQESVLDLQKKLKVEKRAHTQTKQQLYEMERDCLISMRALTAAQKSARALEKKGKQGLMKNMVKDVSMGDLQWYYKRKVAEMRVNPASGDILSRLLEDEMDFGGEKMEDASSSASRRKRKRRR